MSINDAMRGAAEQNGVQQEFWDIFGHHHVTSPETNRAILQALGFDCTDEQTLAASIHGHEAKDAGRKLPPVLVMSQNAPLNLPVNNAEIITEKGERIAFNGSYTDKLPLGYHKLRAQNEVTRLIVTPDCAVLPKPGRQAGFGIMLHSLRSARNWGCGDIRDLRELTTWAAEKLNVNFIALNPLHAIHNRAPYNTSPYLPNSIFYRNFLYLNVEAIPGFRMTDHIRDTAARLRQTPTVEYDQAATLKAEALRQIFRENPPSKECKDWIAAEGELLRLFCTYCVLDYELHKQNPDLWVWPQWPAQYQDPRDPAVKEFAAKHEQQILYCGWLQWLLDQQLADAQAHAKATGMTIGLYHDLALATDSCGSDLWAHRDFYIPGCRVGSPPDDFSPTGQDWSFPPPNSERHREDGYCLYAESIRKSMRQGGALRIDHVMRLFRLYWIPPGHDATQGAYVRDRAEDLIRILALESVRNQAVIVGEDLGTVEDNVRETLARFGILSYRLLYFERTGDYFKAPGDYPAQALAATTTHDLATITGFWTGADIDARLNSGMIDQASHASQLASRTHDKQRLLDALFAANLMPQDYERRADCIPELTGEIHYAIMGFLASTPAAMWLVNNEDLTKEPAQQNLPGTTAQYPNWSHKMRWSLEDLRTCKEATDCAIMIRHWIDSSSRGRP